MSSYDKRNSEYGKVVCGIKKIVAFYNLSLNMHYLDDPQNQIGKLEIEALVDSATGNRMGSKLGIVPILICNGISQEFTGKPSENVKRYINKMKLTQKEREIVFTLCLLILRDWIGNDEVCEEEKYKKYLSVLVE